VLQIQMPQLQLEDVASILALAKTAKIDAGDAIAVGQLIERVDVALAFAKVQASAPKQAGPATPADGTGEQTHPAPAGTKSPGAIARAVKAATEGGATPG
jgi:hypothetical protein